MHSFVFTYNEAAIFFVKLPSPNSQVTLCFLQTTRDQTPHQGPPSAPLGLSYPPIQSQTPAHEALPWLQCNPPQKESGQHKCQGGSPTSLHPHPKVPWRKAGCQGNTRGCLLLRQPAFVQFGADPFQRLCTDPAAARAPREAPTSSFRPSLCPPPKPGPAPHLPCELRGRLSSPGSCGDFSRGSSAVGGAMTCGGGLQTPTRRGRPRRRSSRAGRAGPGDLYLRHERHESLLHGARADVERRARAQRPRGGGGRRDTAAATAAAARGRGHDGGGPSPRPQPRAQPPPSRRPAAAAGVRPAQAPPPGPPPPPRGGAPSRLPTHTARGARHSRGVGCDNNPRVCAPFSIFAQEQARGRGGYAGCTQRKRQSGVVGEVRAFAKHMSLIVSFLVQNTLHEASEKRL